MTDSAAERAHAYYRALDGRDYDALADLLAEGFVHDRPDRTIEGRDRFVAFMRDERPRTDTSHRVDGVFTDRERNEGRVAVRGRLLAADGTEITAFVDVFSETDGVIDRIETYTD